MSDDETRPEEQQEEQFDEETGEESSPEASSDLSWLHGTKAGSEESEPAEKNRAAHEKENADIAAKPQLEELELKDDLGAPAEAREPLAGREEQQRPADGLPLDTTDDRPEPDVEEPVDDDVREPYEGPGEYETVVADVARYVDNGYDLISLAGYSGSGKTHFLRAVSLLLKRQGFEVADWDRLRKARVPGPTETTVFQHAATNANGEKYVFLDAGGELYAHIQANDWELGDSSLALLHSLYHCRGLFLLLHLQPGHFRLGALGEYRKMPEPERQRDAEAQQAQEELEFFDHFLLFLRALQAEEGNVRKLVSRCEAEPHIDRALRRYRDEAPRLDIPVQVLFTQADAFSRGDVAVAEAIYVAPRKTIGVAPFVARHLPSLFGTLLSHARRFRFDFVQSYEEKKTSSGKVLPLWESDDGEYLSCSVMPALEFLVKNTPARGFLGRLLRRRELETRTAMRINRFFNRKRWRGVEVGL